jgi:hypothetical protein
VGSACQGTLVEEDQLSSTAAEGGREEWRFRWLSWKAVVPMVGLGPAAYGG